MADLRIELSDVVVCLSAPESVLAWRRQLRVPVSCLRMVHVEEDPVRGISLIGWPGLHRAAWCWPGLCWPGLFAVGTCRRDRRREFVAVRSGRPAVVLDIEGCAWDRVLVSVPRAVEVAADLAALLLGRSPGVPAKRGRSLPAPPQD